MWEELYPFSPALLSPSYNLDLHCVQNILSRYKTFVYHVLEVIIPVHVENPLVVVGAQLLQLFPLNQVHEDVQLHLKDEKQ